jgi:hypothetical protein
MGEKQEAVRPEAEVLVQKLGTFDLHYVKGYTWVQPCPRIRTIGWKGEKKKH